MGWAFHNRINKDGQQSIVYQVYYRGKRFSIPTGVSCKKKEFKAGVIKNRIHDTMKLGVIKGIILTSIDQAKKQLPAWAPEYLEMTIKAKLNGSVEQDGKLRHRLFEYWGERIEYYKRAGQFDMASHSINSRIAVFSVLDRDIFIDEIKLSHLLHLKDELLIGRSPSSVNGYFRDMKAVIRRSDPKEDPFRGFESPKMKKKTNIALNWDEFVSFESVECKTPFQQIAKDTFLLCYYCGGMRIRDALLLTWGNIEGDRLIYNTSKTGHHFNFAMPAEAQEIIKKYDRNSKYILPVLQPGLTGEEKVKDIRNKISALNRSLKRLARYCGITKTLSTHGARHTMVSVNRHLSLSDIKEIVGHGDEKTTQNYVETVATQDHLMNRIKRPDTKSTEK